MKKWILLFKLTFGILTFSFAQTEISGYLDSTPLDGISGTVATFDLFGAVEACRNLVHDGKSDWYLPTIEEILLFANGASDTGATPSCVGTNCNWINTSFIITRTHQLTHSGGAVQTRFIIFKHLTSAVEGSTGPLYYSPTSGTQTVRCVR